MSDFEDPRDDPRIRELEQRLNDGLQAIEGLNRVKHPNEPKYMVDMAELKVNARMEALAAILVGQGTIDSLEFTGEHLTREAEGVEAALAAFQEVKRKFASGLIVPGQNGLPG